MSARIEIPVDSPLFAGHFPGRPIFPGIAHLDLVARALPNAGFQEVRSLKLRRPAGPGDVLSLTLQGPGGEGMVRFELRRGEEAVSTGIVLAAPAGWRPAGPSPIADVPGEFPPVSELIPHGPPARLIDSVITTAAEGIVCRAVIPSDHPLADNGQVPAFLGLEAAAQAAAALEALGRREAPGPRLGYLVGIRDARFGSGSLPTGQPFRAIVRLHGSAPPLSMYRVALEGACGEILAGTISTFLLED